MSYYYPFPGAGRRCPVCGAGLVRMAPGVAGCPACRMRYAVG